MNITILGEYIDNSLSKLTLNALNRVSSISNNISIQLLLMNKDVPITEIRVPRNTTIYNYKNYSAISLQSYKNLLKSYLSENNTDFIVVSTKQYNEELVPYIGETLQILSFIDVTNIYVDEDEVHVVKSEYSGNVDADYTIEDKAVLSFRQKKDNELHTNDAISQKVLHKATILRGTESDVIRSVYRKQTDDLDTADIVIVCGFGVGSKKEIEKIQAYANSIGAVVAGTKKVTDSGWLPVNALIGQTGHIIAPKLLIAIGVSGAAPLLNGIMDSKTIIAINKDKDARIFNYADYGIIGDYNKILKEGFDIL